MDTFRTRYGPVALVSGSAQGIGLEFARALAARGLDLVLVDIRDDLLPGVAAELERAHGVETHPVVLDVGERSAGDRFRELAEQHEIGLGIANAAIGGVGPFLSESLDAHRARLAVNCGGALSLCHALSPAMLARGRGGLILLSSMAGLQGTAGVASYSATKAYDLALAEALWYELKPGGIDVVAVLPGSTDTPGMRSSHPREDRVTLMPAEQIAAEGLDALGRVPRHVCGEANQKVAEALAKLPLEQLLQVMGDQMARLYENPDPGGD
ncbi:MAG: SDR family NAD(P)-dependent oxidoreductase [Myxococcota bacterium]